MILWLSLLTWPAVAGSPELDALAGQIQRGLDPEALVQIINGLPPLDSEAVVELLRAGAAPITLEDAGYPPTPEQVATADALGPWVQPAHAPSVHVRALDTDEDEDEDEDEGESRPTARTGFAEPHSEPTSEDLARLWRTNKTRRALAGVGVGLEALGLGIILIQAPKGGDTTVGTVISVVGGVSLTVSWVL